MQGYEEVGKARGKMDIFWTSLTRPWWKSSKPKLSGDFDSQRTYCAKYDRLAGGDEVFCDQLRYATVQEEEEDEHRDGQHLQDLQVHQPPVSQADHSSASILAQHQLLLVRSGQQRQCGDHPSSLAGRG